MNLRELKFEGTQPTSPQTIENKQKKKLDTSCSRHYSSAVTCKECKTEFTRTRPWQRYCSLKCGNRARGKKRTRLYRKALAVIRKNQLEREAV